MKRWIFVTALAVLVSDGHPAWATSGSETPSCKKATAAIGKQTGATILRLSASRDTVYLKQIDVSSIALFCSEYYDPFASVSVGNKAPPAAYYDVVAKVAAVLFAGSATTFEAASIKCQAAAQKNDEGTSSVVVGPAALDCAVKKAEGDDDDDLGTTAIKIGPRTQ